jgi:hypothetical protein
MDPLHELVTKYRDRLGFLDGKGWGGCTCDCHRPNSGVMHIQACCHLSPAEIEEIKRLFANDPEAQALLARCIDHALRNLSFDEIGGLLGALGGLGRLRR